VVVAVAGSHHPSVPADSTHLAEYPNGILHVLQHLVSMDDVERSVIEWQGSGIGLTELDVVNAGFGARCPCFVEDVGNGVDGYDSGGRDETSQIARDRARPAADVEEIESGSEVGQQVGGRVLGRARPVGAKDAVVMPVGVQSGPATRRCEPARRRG
jgi:hypothetical protein